MTRLLLTAACCLVFLLVTVASLAAQLSEFMDKVTALEQQWEDEQAAIGKITELGGWVVREDCIEDKDVRENLDPEKRQFVVEVNMVYHEDGASRVDNANLSPDALEAIGKCRQVRRVLLKETQANDGQLKHLAGLERIEELYMWSAGDVSDDGLKQLQGLKRLKKLHVSNSQITDEGIGYLTGLPLVEKLSLQNNAFSDEVFRHAASFPNLKELWVGLGDNSFTDAGLRHLEQSVNLESLDVQQSGISDEAVASLREKLPNLATVHH